MKKIRRVLSMTLVVMLMISITAVPVSAAGYSDHAYVGTSVSFTSEWEKTRTYSVSSGIIGYMVYGYDVDWINEDYVWTKATECYSTASVQRAGHDTSYCSGTEQGKNTYSKIEVTHQTYYVYYKIAFSVSYSNVSYSTASTSVK